MRTTGFLCGAGFHRAVKSLTIELPGSAADGDQEHTTLRLDPTDAGPLAVAPLNVGWALRRPPE